MWWELVHADAEAEETTDQGASEVGGICGPGVRWGHTCNAVRGGRYLYVFGGYGRDNCQTNDVHVFDTVQQSWSKPMLKGVPPSPRDSHSCTTVGDKLFVFGGTDGKNPLKDMHILDTSSNTWIVPNLNGEGPDAREGHTAVLVDKRLFIFGGCGKSVTHEEKYFNDLYILDTGKFSQSIFLNFVIISNLEVPVLYGIVETLTWERAVTSGTPPSARDCHSCSSWKNKIIVLGGEDSSDFYLADVHILNADTLAWEPMKTAGKIFPPRAGHTTVALGSNLFVFGGFTDARNLYDDLYVLNVGNPLNIESSALLFDLLPDMPVLNGLCDQRPAKLSIRRELRKKCRQDYLPSQRILKNNYFLKKQMISGSLHADHLRETDQAGTMVSDLKPTGEITFEARVTNSNKYGYAIETIIDGKLLHGMLFSCTSNLSQDNHGYHKKRVAVDNMSDKGNMDRPICVANAPVEVRKSSDHGQPNSSSAKESTVCRPLVEAPSSNLMNSTLVKDRSLNFPDSTLPQLSFVYFSVVPASWNVDQSSRMFMDTVNNDASDGAKPPNDRNFSGNLSISAEAQSSLLIQGKKFILI
ncbi:hypothetical protein C4D60_Mb01t01980 [Musa balbisiana]|uniref:Uncharacterized protein n=1 Tax=Musa balbisiana TaxID=52838 RepID=A0A4S8JJ73_MUSBA|nr:hypothetical protein C4D60_Mb01t01980 [Musa balbisiana]